MVDARAEPSMSHVALLYSSPADAARRLLPSIDESLDRGAAVLMCVDDTTSTAVHDALGSRAKHVDLHSSGTPYARPAHAVEALAHYIAQCRREGTDAVHTIGAVPLSAGTLDPEWVRYEAACNVIFAGLRMQATCLYPRSLGDDAMEAVAATHPVLDDDGVVPSPGWHGAHAACAHVRFEPLAPSRPPELFVDQVVEPRQARCMVSDALVERGRVDDDGNVGLVVSELVTNAILHGGGSATVAVWFEPESAIVSVHDEGTGIDDPFAGLWPPALPERGAGLWVANHLSERVVIDRSPHGGAAITVELHAPPAGRVAGRTSRYTTRH
jgi:anti-sigma regulatory factor (Ser/Thr protein kinase)